MQSANEEGRSILVEPNQEAICNDNRKLVCNCWKILSLGRVLIALTILIIGSVYFDECPAQPLLPIYLIVEGTLSFVYYAYMLWAEAQTVAMMQALVDVTCDTSQFFLCCCHGIREVFHFIWFIFGCLWTSSLRDAQFTRPDDPSQMSHYCNKVVPNFTACVLCYYSAVLAWFFYDQCIGNSRK